MMGIAVAEESGFYLGAAIGFVETDDVHIEIHRPIEVRDHQIDVAEPSRLEKFAVWPTPASNSTTFMARLPISACATLVP